MNSIEYIKNVGTQKPTFSSSILNTTKQFFDINIEKERKIKRIQHAENMNSFLFNC